MARGSRVAQRNESTVHCVVDSVSAGIVSGWAHDPKHQKTPLIFYAILDGQQIGDVVCSGSRPDVADTGAAPETVGFQFAVPREWLDGSMRHLEFRDLVYLAAPRPRFCRRAPWRCVRGLGA
jgi:hypothetical protein